MNTFKNLIQNNEAISLAPEIDSAEQHSFVGVDTINYIFSVKQVSFIFRTYPFRDLFL